MKHIKIALTAAFQIMFVLTCVEVALSNVVITTDTTWQGVRNISGDLIIPDGVTLTISKGSRIHFTKELNPETPSEKEVSLPQVLVQGHLEVEGDEGKPVIFSAAGQLEKKGWTGIVVDDGNAWLHEARIEDAEIAVHLKTGWVKLKKSIVTNNCCGVVVMGARSGVKVESSTITGNNYGLIHDDSAVVSFPTSTIRGNQEKDIFSYNEGQGPVITTLCSCDLSRENDRTTLQGHDPIKQNN